jgi:hypothetical protein
MNARLSMGRRVQRDSDGDEKPPRPKIIGQTVGFQIRAEAEQTILLGYELELLPSTAKDANAADNSVVRAEGRVTLELGKPTVINATDVDGQPSFQIEVKATRIKP